MRRVLPWVLIGFLIVLAVVLAGQGAFREGTAPGQERHSTPYGLAAHSTTFGLPPKRVALPFRLTPSVVPTVEMYDSVTVSTVPAGARVVAGYTAGFWPTFNPLVRAFPRAAHVSIAIASRYRARCLDIEPGDANPSQASGWYRSMRAQGIARPCLYANLSTMPSVRANLAAHGISRARVLLWDADWTYRAHLDAGYDATQWTDHAFGRNLDESTVTLAFAGIKPVPPPEPKPRPHPHPNPVPKPHPKPAPRRDPRLRGLVQYRSRLHALRAAHRCYAARPRPVRYRGACRTWLREYRGVERRIRHLEVVA